MKNGTVFQDKVKLGQSEVVSTLHSNHETCKLLHISYVLGFFKRKILVSIVNAL